MSDTPNLSKYKDVCPETVARLYNEELSRRKNAKEAEKALKTALHQITGAFMTPDELKKARKLAASEQENALYETLRLHASTRERLEHIEEFYNVLLKFPDVHSILDLACGLNPIWLGSQGWEVHGLDISGGCVGLINDWAQAKGWPVEAQCRDLLCEPELPQTDVALAMKLLPVLEQQKKGSALALMKRIPAPIIIVTFPMKTLGGRSIGMEKHYSEWFENTIAENFDIINRNILFDELCYIVRRKAGN